ncbi:MAG: WHG domain-containing protein [Clostridia bacterium]|nr:WHG domain-containing protein [Clostridia bacterium]
MPPKAKFTRDDVIKKAIDLVEREGIDALSARSLGKELGSSARPIFTLFSGMDEVIAAVHSYANSLYGNYVEKGLSEELPFKGVGKAYIRFACERPRLFQLLFMQEIDGHPDKNAVLQGIEEHYEEIILSIQNSYGLEREKAIGLYFHLWVYSHGIAVLIATKVCVFSEDQITQMITEIFTSLLKRLKTEGRL